MTVPRNSNAVRTVLLGGRRLCGGSTLLRAAMPSPSGVFTLTLSSKHVSSAGLRSGGSHALGARH